MDQPFRRSACKLVLAAALAIPYSGASAAQAVAENSLLAMQEERIATSGQDAYPELKPVREALVRLDRSILRLRKIKGTPVEERLLFELSGDVERLYRFSQTIAQVDVADYSRSLSYDAELLESAAEIPDRSAIIQDVADDIHIKQPTLMRDLSIPIVTGRVVVRVVTKRGTVPVPGYVVTLNPVRWRGRDPMFRLPELSPSVGSVPPGRYEIAARREGSIVAKDVVRVGLASEKYVKIDLPVP